MTIALVHQAANTTSTPTGTSCPVTITATTAGSLLVLVIGVQSASITISGVTDSASGTWSQAKHLFSASAAGVDIWYSANVASGITSVTATESSGVSFSANVSEWSGVVSSSPVRTTNSSLTSSSPNTTGSITPVAGDLIVGAFAANSATARTISVGNELTKGVLSASFNHAGGYVISTDTTAQNIQWTTASAASTAGVSASFIPAAASSWLPSPGPLFYRPALGAAST